MDPRRPATLKALRRPLSPSAGLGPTLIVVAVLVPAVSGLQLFLVYSAVWLQMRPSCVGVTAVFGTTSGRVKDVSCRSCSRVKAASGQSCDRITAFFCPSCGRVKAVVCVARGFYVHAISIYICTCYITPVTSLWPKMCQCLAGLNLSLSQDVSGVQLFLSQVAVRLKLPLDQAAAGLQLSFAQVAAGLRLCIVCVVRGFSVHEIIIYLHVILYQ